jgi:hypothetical protein
MTTCATGVVTTWLKGGLTILILRTFWSQGKNNWSIFPQQQWRQGSKRMTEYKYRITYKNGNYADWASMQKELARAYRWGVFLYAIRLNIGAWRAGHKSFKYWLYVLRRKPKITREKV